MLIVALFAAGYLAIVFEHALKLDKSASALITGVACWTVYIVQGDATAIDAELAHHMGEVSQILFFLLGAMAIVELIDANDGFSIITSRIQSTSRRKLLVIVAVISFVLSAVLDNLTTSIVMMQLVRKLASEERDRKYFGAIVIIAANAGGAWSPIGDVTTTMLWIGGQVTTGALLHLFIPAFVSLIVPLVWIALRLRGNMPAREREVTTSTVAERNVVFFVGIGMLLFVPVFKTLTHLPPFMGILLGVGVLWAVTRKSERSLPSALERVDAPSILFFLGILLAISALASDGKLVALATHMNAAIGNVDIITMLIGLASAIVDNVPLVAAAQGMYPLTTFGQDHQFWVFLAYCAGTGGSILIIGSAAGIAVMGIQKISFGWYLKRISLPALLGYVAGALTYLGLAQL